MLVKLGVFVAPLDMWQGRKTLAHGKRNEVGGSEIFCDIREPDEQLQTSPPDVARRRKRCVVEKVAVMFLLIANRTGVLGPELRCIDADVVTPEGGFDEGRGLLVDGEGA